MKQVQQARIVDVDVLLTVFESVSLCCERLFINSNTPSEVFHAASVRVHGSFAQSGKRPLV
eukprot:1548527-Amphidinium_carterae.1